MIWPLYPGPSACHRPNSHPDGGLAAYARRRRWGGGPAPASRPGASACRLHALTGAHWPVCLPARCPALLQWDKVENKTSVVVYGAGSVVTLWLASTIVGALNGIPLVSERGPAQHPDKCFFRTCGAPCHAGSRAL